MNERIRQLIEQATVYKEGIIEGKYDIEVFDKEKFAELLIKESADYIDAFNRENMVEEGMGGAELKKHFGIE